MKLSLKNSHGDTILHGSGRQKKSRATVNLLQLYLPDLEYRRHLFP